MAKRNNEENWDDISFRFLAEMFASARKTEEQTKEEAEPEMTAEEAEEALVSEGEEQADRLLYGGYRQPW